MTKEREIPQNFIEFLNEANQGNQKVVEKVVELQSLVGDETKLGVYGIAASKGTIYMIIEDIESDDLTSEQMEKLNRDYQSMLRNTVEDEFPLEFIVGAPIPYREGSGSTETPETKEHHPFWDRPEIPGRIEEALSEHYRGESIPFRADETTNQ